MTTDTDIKSLFNIQNPRQTIIGSILIDTDPLSGWEPDMVRLKSDFRFLNPYLTLSLLPTGLKISDNLEDTGLLFAESWFNGFAYPCSKLYNIKNVKEDSIKWLNKHGCILLSQELSSRSPQLLNALFSHMCWYGSTKKRLSNLETCEVEKINRLRKSGLICSNWKENPVKIRYAIKKDKKYENDMEFLYLIGGSDLVLDYENYTQIFQDLTKYCITMTKKDNYKISSDLPSCFVEWKALDKSNNVKITENLKQQDADWQNIQKIYRFCAFINLTRNFLKYAKNVLGENEYKIYELDGKKEELSIISTDELFNRLDPIYKYLKTITLVYRKI